MENSFHREILEENACSSKSKGKLGSFTHAGNWVSEKTGNSCEVTIQVKDSCLIKIAYSGQGSALSQACGSLMCNEVEGMDVKDVLKLCLCLFEYVEKGIAFNLPGDLIVYQTISRFSERHDCSLLSWRALEKALK